MPDTPKDKKRKRSRSDEQIAPSSVGPHVIRWLEKRKKKVPDALLDDTNNLMQIEHILRLLALKERERRALVRYVEKRVDEEMNGGPEKVELQDSDGEYDINSNSAAATSHHHKQQEHQWPSSVTFSNNYEWEPSVSADIKEKYYPSNKVRQRSNHFSRKVYFKRITDKDHPAYGQFGLFCALHAKPGQWLLDYVGNVSLGEDQNKDSDYVSDFGNHSELACDANVLGNEARFLNDFRNTGSHPNVEFNFRRDKNGEFRQGVYVKQAKEAKEQGFNGINQDEELLVSYGKSYWRSRVKDLTEFVWRLPNQPMPPEGKPN